MSIFEPLYIPGSIVCSYNVVRAFAHGEYCDLKITCKTLTLNVHKVVVCSTCEFFKKSLAFTVGKESEEQCIELPEDDPEMISRLITYLYTGDYEPCDPTGLSCFFQMEQYKPAPVLSPTPHPYSEEDCCACLVRSEKCYIINEASRQIQISTPLSIHADMYALGDKYQVAGLQYVAASKFKACLAHHRNSPDFITALQTVYTSTPDSNRMLRDVVVQGFKDHFGIDITKDPAIEAKLDTIDELSLALLSSWPKNVDPPKVVKASTQSQAHYTPGIGALGFSTTNTTTVGGLFGQAGRTGPPDTFF